MSLSSSPTTSSLLFPSNPAFSSPESAPTGGILINPHRNSESFAGTSLSTTDSNDAQRYPAIIDSPIAPALPSPIIDAPQSILSPPMVSSKTVPSSTDATTPRIRFAPLPDPRRPRSLSTGRNVVWKASMEPNGDRTRSISIKGMVPNEWEEDDEALDVADGEDGEGGEEVGKRGRNWTKSMSGSWRGTKKLLGYSIGAKEKERDEVGYTEGAPLKKSVSTGGFIGASPFRFSSEQERKRSMQGLPSPILPAPYTSAHRRNSSLEITSTSRQSSSPAPSPAGVKLLNGRVYGSRRASEAAERERILREENEPAFVEWGHGKSSGGMGSNASRTAGKGCLDDEEDGSGMEWVRRRKEERERQKREQEMVASPVEEEGPRTPSLQTAEAQGHTQAIPIPTRADLVPSEARDIDYFGENVSPAGSDRDEESEDGEGEDDDDEQEEKDVARTTSSAAGVEKISRHKD